MFDFYQKLEVNDSWKAGRVEGRVEGQSERQITDARRMKAHGDDIAYIAEITELPIEEIERL
jgi:predicted transposase/invertase (TIGR01784 family)